ncbi:hypothetical protein [Candidatus Methylomirabilis sp.]|uniref:hypothetical protein n=1 Tax=Candidatus Methylomirabilis sp. TaxID=2032687 RepID=UPI002A691D8F|nr:hypothetical protein [Candidatus Methylomirabilis sp.]
MDIHGELVDVGSFGEEFDGPVRNRCSIHRMPKTLHTNRRPALGVGLSLGTFDTDRCHHVSVRAAVGELGR